MTAIEEGAVEEGAVEEGEGRGGGRTILTICFCTLYLPILPVMSP